MVYCCEICENLHRPKIFRYTVIAKIITGTIGKPLFIYRKSDVCRIVHSSVHSIEHHTRSVIGYHCVIRRLLFRIRAGEAATRYTKNLKSQVKVLKVCSVEYSTGTSDKSRYNFFLLKEGYGRFIHRHLRGCNLYSTSFPLLKWS